MCVVTDNWLAVAGRLGKPDVPGNHRLKNLQPVKIAQISRDRGRKIGSLVIHREQQALDHQSRIVKAPDPCERVEEFGYAFESVVLTLNRNQQRLRGRQRVERQQSERRRTVDDDVIVIRLDGCERTLQPELSLLDLDQFDLRPSQILI